jgi:hypothetical protein
VYDVLYQVVCTVRDSRAVAAGGQAAGGEGRHNMGLVGEGEDKLEMRVVLYAVVGCSLMLTSIVTIRMEKLVAYIIKQNKETYREPKQQAL